MRILYISYLFQPTHEIGAVRPSNMCRQLAEFGHQVTLVTANPQAGTRSGGCDTHIVPHGALVGRAMKKLSDRARARLAAGEKPHGYALPEKGKRRRGDLLKTTFYRCRLWLWELLCQTDWALCARRHIRRTLKKDYDVIVSSFGPLGSLFAGRWARRRGYAPRWIADMRDPIANSLQLPAEQKSSLRREKRTLRRADMLLTVSDGFGAHFKSLAKTEAQRAKIAVLENGFEPGAAAPAPADGVLRLVYTGQLYQGRYVFTAALAAAADLVGQGLIPPDGLEIHYAGLHSYEFLRTAQAAGAEALATDHGLLKRPEALALQERGDILCVLTFNSPDTRGWLPAKFWEYLRAERPVLSLSAGETPGAELTARVRALGAGFAYEYVSAAADDGPLRAWLLAAWRCKAAGRPIPYAPDRAAILDYRYDNRARRMEALCLAVCEEKGVKRP